MPELPEVESTVKRLEPNLIGRTITDVKIFWERSVALPSAATFKKKLRGKKIVAASRRAKYMVFSLSPSGFLLIHLRMSGKTACFSKETQPIKHTRIVFELDNGTYLRFDDVRKFGKCFYTERLEDVTGDLGIEPLEASFDEFKPIFNAKRTIKSLLLDQHKIAGIGNIYADETLWMSKIHPERLASTLSEKELKALYNAIRKILPAAIKAEGTDFGDNVVTGNFHPKIYGKAGLPCPRCKTPIEKITVGQRGTHFCPNCQAISK